MSSSGWPIQRLSRRVPIAVLVLSRTEISEASASPQRPPSNSSRFRLVCGSSTMWLRVE